jgi:hypothetical protein
MSGTTQTAPNMTKSPTLINSEIRSPRRKQGCIKLWIGPRTGPVRSA